MRVIGRGVSNRVAEVILEVQPASYDRGVVLREIKKSAEELGYFAKYYSRARTETNPHVYFHGPDKTGRLNHAYVFIRDTLEADKKKIVILNRGFEKDELECLIDIFSGEPKPVSQQRPCEQLSLSLPD